MKMNFDLGQKEPTGPLEYMLASPTEARADKAVETRYPHFHYEGDKELEIPDEGEMTIKYKIVWKQEEEAGDKERYACKVEVRCICECEEEVEAPAKVDKGASNALDGLMKALMESQKD